MALPDFLIIGAMKCGTSTLQAQLAHQPGVFMTTPKEPNYFSDDPVFAKGQAWYEALFAQAAPNDLKGEASTHYTKLPTHPETLGRMRAVLTAPRLVYMIRDPMARAISHYIHGWSEGRFGPDASETFRQTPEIAEYGCYGMQIAPYIEAYGADRVHLTSLEQVNADPEAEFGRIGAFLGLPEGTGWIHDLPAQNVSASRVRRLPLQGLLINNPVATALRRALVPGSIRRRVRERRTMAERPGIPADLQARLEARFLEDRAQLAQHFPDHPALDLCYPFARS
jgi:hypothetical protein